MLSSLYALPFYDFDLRVSHARTLLPAALASVPFGFVLVRVRVRATLLLQPHRPPTRLIQVATFIKKTPGLKNDSTRQNRVSFVKTFVSWLARTRKPHMGGSKV